MDTNITALLTAVIVGGFSIATMYLTNRHNQQQNEASLRFRLTETAFNARLQAFGEMAMAMQSVNRDFGRFYVHAGVAEKKDDAHNSILIEAMADKPVDPVFLIPLRQSTRSCVDTYYKYRMFLTPKMDEIASSFMTDYCEPYRDFGAEYTYRDAFNDTKNDDPYTPVDDLTAEMREYIASVEEGKVGIMDRIIALLGDPIFWFATIFVGFLLSIFANLASDGLKKLWGRFSARQREKNRKEKESIEYLGKLCAASPSYLNIRISDATWFQLEATTFTVMVVTLLFIMIALSVVINPTSWTRLRDLDILSPSTMPAWDPLYLTKIPITAGRFWLRMFLLVVTGGELYLAYLSYKYRNLSNYNVKIVNHARNIIRKELESSTKTDQKDQ